MYFEFGAIKWLLLLRQVIHLSQTCIDHSAYGRELWKILQMLAYMRGGQPGWVQVAQLVNGD